MFKSISPVNRTPLLNPAPVKYWRQQSGGLKKYSRFIGEAIEFLVLIKDPYADLEEHSTCVALISHDLGVFTPCSGSNVRVAVSDDSAPIST